MLRIRRTVAGVTYGHARNVPNQKGRVAIPSVRRVEPKRMPLDAQFTSALHNARILRLEKRLSKTTECYVFQEYEFYKPYTINRR